MSDFVAEVRPRTQCIRTCPPPHPANDFVAEIRPRNDNSLQLRHSGRHCDTMDCSNQYLENILSNSHFSRERITRVLEGSILTLVEKLLSGRPITRIEGCLCISLASHESPLTVNLNRTFPIVNHGNDHSLTNQSLESRLNVKVKHGDLSLARDVSDMAPEHLPMTPTDAPLLLSTSNDKSFAADASFYECERDAFYNISDNDDRSCFPLENTRDGERCSPSPPGDFPCKPTSPGKDIRITLSSFQTESCVLGTRLEESRRHESDDESGYTSNEKEDCDSHSERTDSSHEHTQCGTFNDYYCSGFDGKSTVYSSDEKDASVGSPSETTYYSPGSSGDGGDEIDDDDDEDYMDFEVPLVIDERPLQNTRGPRVDQTCRMDVQIGKEDGQPMETDRGRTMRMPYRRVEQDILLRNERMRDYLIDDTEALDSPVSSDITDTDVPVDLSGDSSVTLDATWAIPHPQSMVVKHADGFRCKQCSQIMVDAEAVSRHAQTDHELYCCTFCCRTFTAKNNLKRHIRIHTGHRPYQCAQCSQSFARRDDLKAHVLRHDYSKPFRCSLCKKGYTDRACVKNHMAKEHRSRLMHVCPQCGESYDQEEAFTAHKKTHPELQQFSCGTCSFIGNNNLMTLKHSLLHSHKLFSCKPCNAYFADPFDYTNHVRKHKKIAAFSQYVCCFCDVALATYDQYVRHEYSHAQGKTHACRTCKKQFKNKSLLQEHALSHEKPQLDQVHSDHMFTTSVEIKEPCPVFFQPKEITDNSVSKPSRESRFTDDYSNFCCDSPVQATCAEAVEEEESSGSEEQLLDLRVKKTSDLTYSANDVKQSDYSFRACSRGTGLADKNFPRNGVVLPGSCYLDQEREMKEAYQAREPVCKERRCETIFTPIMSNMNNEYKRRYSNDKLVHNIPQDGVDSEYNRRYSSDKVIPNCPPNSVNKHQMSYHHIKSVSPARPQSVEKPRVNENAPYTRFECRPLQRTVSQEYTRRTPLRFNPYSREKMADLAAKFIAARGTKLFEERGPLKAVLATCENRGLLPVCRDVADPRTEASSSPTSPRHQTELKNGHVFKQSPMFFSSSPVACPTILDIDDISREDSNPETALMYHAPIVVKSEVLLDQDLEVDASENCRFQKTIGGNANHVGDSLNGVSHYHNHSCEDCKKEFESFAELEHHSVEMHKRYLCEHCGKTFTARPNRDRHVRYHTGERPYRCDLCEQAFFRGDDLKYHRTTRHPTAQPYTCTHCSATFTWGRDLDRHIRHSKCKS